MMCRNKGDNWSGVVDCMQIGGGGLHTYGPPSWPAHWCRTTILTTDHLSVGWVSHFHNTPLHLEWVDVASVHQWGILIQGYCHLSHICLGAIGPPIE